MRVALFAAAALVAAAPAAAQEHGIDTSQIGDACPPEVRETMAEAARAGLERASKRWEESIRRPEDLGELSCLDGIMNRDLGILVDLPSIDDLFGSIEDMVCEAAEEGWRQATSRVNGAASELGTPDLQLPGGIGGISSGGISVEQTNNPLTVRGGQTPGLPGTGTPPINGEGSGSFNATGSYDYFKSIFK